MKEPKGVAARTGQAQCMNSETSAEDIVGPGAHAIRANGDAHGASRVGPSPSHGLVGGESADHVLQPCPLLGRNASHSSSGPVRQVASRSDGGEPSRVGIATVREHPEAAGLVAADPQLLDDALAGDRVRM